MPNVLIDLFHYRTVPSLPSSRRSICGWCWRELTAKVRMHYAVIASKELYKRSEHGRTYRQDPRLFLIATLLQCGRNNEGTETVKGESLSGKTVCSSYALEASSDDRVSGACLRSKSHAMPWTINREADERTQMASSLYLRTCDVSGKDFSSCSSTCTAATGMTSITTPPCRSNACSDGVFHTGTTVSNGFTGNDRQGHEAGVETLRLCSLRQIEMSSGLCMYPTGPYPQASRATYQDKNDTGSICCLHTAT